ncbi:Fic family protein [Paenibacillus taichungensis]|uniref:Fic family protein n=2 Tax=Paenibacillus taichungensis TaxID=484184 RepID=A0ABX2MI47_9BACL|nr:Fic family protein [Paenibacillus taichungensis]NUU52697.1 Fic family protein [Paenibacillus taichungensis]
MNLDENLKRYISDDYVTRLKFIYRQSDPVGALKRWDEIVKRRKDISTSVNLLDQNGDKLWFVNLPIFGTSLDNLEYAAQYDIPDVVKHITNWEDKSHEMIIDEAFNSSVIEGAVSTRKRTSEMLKKREKPKNHSELMIYNNYEAMIYILEKTDEPLSEETFVKLHKIITEQTLSEEDITEKYRDDDVEVKDMSNNRSIYHAPPAKDVQWMMDDLFKFINEDTPELHPIIKACIIHFYLVYIHPFFDGNGRTTRAFTVLYLLKHGFNFFKYLSISTAIRKEKSKYYKAIEDCEKHPTDLTYFIKNQIELMQNGIKDLLKDLRMEISKFIINKWFDRKGIVLSARQMKEIYSFAKKKNNYTSIEEYRKKYKVSYETARRDLASLNDLDLFKKVKISRKFVYKFDFNEFCEFVFKDMREENIEI